jgi:hypothetical protein
MEVNSTEPHPFIKDPLVYAISLIFVDYAYE